MKYLFLALVGVLALAGSAVGHEFKIGTLEIGHPWSRATPKGASVAAGYLKITNKGTEPDRLIGGSSPVAGRFELHEMATVDGVMKMRLLANGLEIKPGETVEFRPGSFHIMLVGLKQPVEAGNRVKGTLVFEKAGTVDIEYMVVPIGGKPPTEARRSGTHEH